MHVSLSVRCISAGIYGHHLLRYTHMLLLMMTMLLMMMMVTATAAAFLMMLVTIMMMRVVCNSWPVCGMRIRLSFSEIT